MSLAPEWSSWHFWLKCLALQKWLYVRFEIMYFQGVQCQLLKNGLLGVLLSNAKFVYVIIILIRCHVRTSCHSRHPSYGVTAQSFEVLFFEECKSHGVRASGCCLHCICAGVFVPQTFTAKASRCHPLHSRLSVIHPHKTCGGTTGNTNRVLESFYLSKQFWD